MAYGIKVFFAILLSLVGLVLMFDRTDVPLRSVLPVLVGAIFASVGLTILWLIRRKSG